MPEFTLVALMNRDAPATMANLEDIRLLELQIRRDETALLETASPSLRRAFEATYEGLAGTAVEIILRPPPDSGRSLPRVILDMARALVGDPRVAQASQVFRVKGKDRRTGYVELFDLLQDKLVSTRRIALQDGRYRAVDSRSMLAQIGLAYEDLKRSLYQAAGIGEPEP